MRRASEKNEILNKATYEFLSICAFNLSIVDSILALTSAGNKSMVDCMVVRVVFLVASSVSIAVILSPRYVVIRPIPSSN